MSALNVKVSVEALQEHKIQEVTLDGQEIYVEPLSMSENLTKLAHKIDFYKDESGTKGQPASEGELDEPEEKPLAAFVPSMWPWDSVRNQLKHGLVEITVLTDVLKMVRNKRHFVADPVSTENVDVRLTSQLLSKKKSLMASSQMLMSAVDRLKNAVNEANKKGSINFHNELSSLRKNWRLKKVSTSIVGDLSYRSAGSRFWQRGSFHVRKSTELDKSDGRAEAGTDGPAVDDVSRDASLQQVKSSLEVTVPSQLEGTAFIQVQVKTVTSLADLTSCALKMPQCLKSAPVNLHWSSKLESAQNVLFCKELFSQLAREAVHIQSATPHLVIGNQIITNVFPGHQLSIVLCHYTGKEKMIGQASQKLDHNHVLEHSLHQLLHQLHRRNSSIDPTHPVVATCGMSKRRRMAGPLGLTRQDLLEMSETESLLSQIIKQTKHAILRLQSMRAIDQMAVSVQDPQITAHWGCLNSALESSVRIFITSVGYESFKRVCSTLSRTSLVLVIGVDTIHVVIKDGRTCQLSFEVTELHDLLHWQIAQHHTSMVQQVAKIQGWQIISANSSIGSSDMESFATASAITIASPKGDKLITFRSGPSSGHRLFLKMDHVGDECHPSPAVTHSLWLEQECGFTDIQLSKLQGRNLANKIDMLMAHVTTL